MPDLAYLDWPIYGMSMPEKQALLTERLKTLTKHHYNNCKAYASLIDAYGIDPWNLGTLDTIPYFPVRLFKSNVLRSIQDDELFKVLTSSGTTSQSVSRIFIDRNTASAQTKALVRIIQSFIGKERLPMLIIDHPGVIRDRYSFSARGAGILGLSNFGRDHTYGLSDENMTLDFDRIIAFLNRHTNERIFIFGFTFMVWRYFVQQIERSGLSVNIPNAVLIHSGGWKKMHDESVDNQTFKSRLASVTGITCVHDFYGMVEQVGSIYMECEHGYLHTPAYSDIIIRNPRDWSVCKIGSEGLIQVLSAIPESYPGHSLLTEDIGILHGEDNCACGRKGKYFTIKGRLKKAEIRGCSDTHATEHQQ